MNERQKIILLYLTRNNSIACNGAGDILARHKLLKRTSSFGSNLCLPGGAVLRSLERLGLVVQFLSSRDQWAIKLYALTESGKAAAKEIEP